MNPAKGRRVNAVRLSRVSAFPASLFPLPRYFRLHDQSIRCRAHVTNRPARGKHERRRRPRIERRVVCAHDTDSGHRPHDRSARALRDHGIAHCDAAERVKVPVAMRGDHARPAVAREYASDHVSRSGSELVVAHAFDHDLVETKSRNDHSSDRRPASLAPSRPARRQFRADNCAFGFHFGPARARRIARDRPSRNRCRRPDEQQGAADDQGAAGSPSRVV
jgi:hypothetical protein